MSAPRCLPSVVAAPRLALGAALLSGAVCTAGAAPVPAPAAPAAPAASAAADSAHPVLDRIRERGYVVLAHREASVPFSYVLPDGKPVGYALDLCHKIVDAISKELKVPLTTKTLLVKPSDRLAVIVDGRADMECGSTTNNAERREKVAFTVPHYITGARFAVRADSPIATLEQFENRKVVSTAGTTPLARLQEVNRERLLRIDIVTAPDHDRAMEMLSKGQVDGFAMDDVLLYGLIAAQPDPSKFKVVGKFLTIEPLAIELSKSDPELKRIADTEMKHLITSGEASAIYDRWFMKPIPPRDRSLNLPQSYLLKDFWRYPSDVVPY
jgi:glutamate/aspartate transport system substrate-binding protein